MTELREPESPTELEAQLKDFENYLCEEMALPAFRIAQSYLGGIRREVAALARPPEEPLEELRRFADGDRRPVAQTYMTAGAAPLRGPSPATVEEKIAALSDALLNDEEVETFLAIHRIEIENDGSPASAVREAWKVVTANRLNRGVSAPAPSGPQ